MVAVAINDHAGQTVALTPNQAAEFFVHSSSRPILDRLCDPPLKEIEVEILFSPGEPARHDLRLGIIDRATDEMIASVLKRNNVAVLWLTEDLQHLTAKDPVVPMQNARSRLYHQSSHDTH